MSSLRYGLLFTGLLSALPLALHSQDSAAAAVPSTAYQARETCDTEDGATYCGGWLQIRVAVGGGFVGTHIAEVIERPALDCSSTPCVPDPTSKLLLANKRYVFKPAVSTGLIFFLPLRRTRAPDQPTGVGVGIGAHIVAVPYGTEGETRAAPAVTLHFGTPSFHIFGGLVALPTDEVRFPNDAKEIAVPQAVDNGSFITRGTGEGPTFFLGVVLGGASIVDLGTKQTP